MGIYISGMEIPASCYKCPLKQRESLTIVCPVAHEMFSVADVNFLDYRLENCPLVPVPEFSDIGFDYDDAWKKIFTLVVLLLSDREKFDKLKDDILADMEGME